MTSLDILKLNKIIQKFLIGFLLISVSFGLVQRSPQTKALQFGSGTSADMVISQNGNVGIGTTAPNSTLQVSGSLAVMVTTTNADITLGAGHYLTAIDASGANRNVALPAVSGCTGREYVIAKVDGGTNIVTITPAGSDTINGDASYVLRNPYEMVNIVSLGTQWLIESK